MFFGFQKYAVASIVLSGLLLFQPMVHAETALKVFSVNGVKNVMIALGEDFTAATGDRVEFTFGTIGALKEKMAAGEMPDVLIAITPAMTEAERRGQIFPGSSVEVGRTGVGIAVKEGATIPDISTPASLKTVLLGTQSLAYSDPQTGAASGIVVAKMLADLGVAEQVKGKSVLIRSGSVGELVAQGTVELGIQQITELLPVRGIVLVGPLPKELQVITSYRAGIMVNAQKPAVAEKFVRFVTSTEEAKRFADAGFGQY